METRDFEPKPDGMIALPSIEINFRGSAHNRCAISSFMEETTKTLLDSFEMIIVHTCSKNIQPLGLFPMSIGLLSEDQRKAWRVRFAYGMYSKDKQFVPCG